MNAYSAHDWIQYLFPVNIKRAVREKVIIKLRLHTNSRTLANSVWILVDSKRKRIIIIIKERKRRVCDVNNILIERGEKKMWWGTQYDGNHININKKTTGEKGLGMGIGGIEKFIKSINQPIQLFKKKIKKKKQYFLNTQQQENTDLIFYSKSN